MQGVCKLMKMCEGGGTLTSNSSNKLLINMGSCNFAYIKPFSKINSGNAVLNLSSFLKSLDYNG